MAELVPKTTPIAVPAAGQPPVPITLTMMCSRVEVSEDPSVNAGVAQGLQGFYTDTQPATGFPNVGNNQVWLPNTAGQQGRGFQPIVFGGDPGRVHGAFGEYVGADGTIILRLNSFTALATQILLTEWP